MEIIDGKKIADEILAELKKQPAPKKILAAILFGDDQVSLSFLKQKESVAKFLNIDFRLYKFSDVLTNDQARMEVRRLALSKSVGGLIVQLPLPSSINFHYVLNVIPREKDIDVLGERSLGAFYASRNPVLPPSVGAVKEVLKAAALTFVEGEIGTSAVKRVGIVGLGFLVGKPIVNWLMGRVGELYLLDKGGNLDILKQADLVISGVGQPGLIKPEMLKAGAGVIDFGYSRGVNGKISGDFDASSASSLSLLSFYTPTPGGVGPIVAAKLLENFYRLNS